MNRRASVKFLVMLAVGGTPLTLAANGMRLVSQDGFATARGEAFVATADNASAVYYNPAGITQLRGSDLRAGVYGLYLDPTYRPPPGAPNDGNTYHLENKLAGVPQFFLTHTLRNHPLSFGLGIYSPYGANASWPQDTGFRTIATRGALTYVTIDPVVAVKLPAGFSLGGGATLHYANIDLQQGLLRAEQPFVNSFRFTGDGWTVGYHFGVLWQPLEQVSVGATFRSSTRVNLEGRTEFEQQPVIPRTERPAQADFTFPLSAGFGVSYRPTPRWNLEVNADYTDWSSFGTVTVRQQEAPPWPVQRDIPYQLGWRPSWLYAFGVTRYLEGGWQVSAGYVFNENSVPDTYYSPLAADLDRHFFSVGIGRAGQRLSFDVAYQFGYGPARVVTGSTPSSQPALFAGQTADGTYNFISHAVLITLGSHF